MRPWPLRLALLAFGLALTGLVFMLFGPAPTASGNLWASRMFGIIPEAATQAPELDPGHPRAMAMMATADSQIEDEETRPRQTELSIARSQKLTDLLIKAGVARDEAGKAAGAIDALTGSETLKKGQEVALTFDRPADGIGSGSFRALVLSERDGHQVVARKTGAVFEAALGHSRTQSQYVHLAGTIQGSLFESAANAGVPAPVLVEMIHAFSYDVDFQRDIQAGDRFEIMFEREIDPKGRIVKNGAILFAKLTLQGEEMPIYRFVDADGQTDYYDAKGASVRKALLRTPVDGARITSGFGMRVHPILGFSMMHKGVDFAVATGTPVMAAGDGTISYAGANGSYGTYVRIDHDETHATAYAHLSRIAAGIRKGRHVKQGEVIAYSGASGRATGPHLHYEVLIDDEQVNPLSVKFQSGRKLAGRELNRFLADIHATGQLLAANPVPTRLAMAK